MSMNMGFCVRFVFQGFAAELANTEFLEFSFIQVEKVSSQSLKISCLSLCLGAFLVPVDFNGSFR